MAGTPASSRGSYTGSYPVVNADIAAGAAIAYSKLNLALGIVNADVAAAAVIAVSKLAGGSAGQVLGGTTPAYAYPPGYQLAYAEIPNPVTVSATVEATPDAVVSSGAVVYDGTLIRIEFYSPEVTVGLTAGGFTILNLWDDVTEIGRMALVSHSAGTEPVSVPVHAVRYLTPTAASHTYKIQAWRINVNGTVGAGPGTIGTDHPAFIRVTKA